MLFLLSLLSVLRRCRPWGGSGPHPL